MLEQYYTTVEDAIRELGLDPQRFRGAPGEWTLQRSAYRIWIDLWYHEEEGQGYFQIVVPLFDLPEAVSPSFYQDLLSTNLELCQAAFALQGDRLLLRSNRLIHGLDSTEVLNHILLISQYAKRLCPQLMDKYFNSGVPGAAPISS